MGTSKQKQMTKRTRRSTVIPVMGNHSQAQYEKATAELEASHKLVLAREIAKRNKLKPGVQRPLPRDYKDTRSIILYPFEKGTPRTKSPETCEEYEKRAIRIMKQFETETSYSVEDDPFRFLLWILIKKQLIASRTWGSDKAALIHYAKKYHLPRIAEYLYETDYHGGKDHGKRVSAKDKRTSAKKRKTYTKEEFKKILENYEKHCTGHWAWIGLCMFITIHYLGMRPLEITQTRYGNYLDDDGVPRMAVHIKNAKHSNGRANGAYRTLFIDHFDEGVKQLIFQAIDSAHVPRRKDGELTTPRKYVDQASAGFSAYTSRLFPRRKTNITLYTARHQFAANAKKSGMPRHELACILGQISDRTNAVHYAHSVSGRRSTRFPRPRASEVATVRRVYKPFNGITRTSEKGNNTAVKQIKGPTL